MSSNAYTKEWWDSLSPASRREVIDVALAYVDDLWNVVFDEFAPLDESWLAWYRQLEELAAVAADDPWGEELRNEMQQLDQAAGELLQLLGGAQ